MTDNAKMIAEARQNIEHLARGIPGSMADRVRAGEAHDPRTSLVVRLANALEASERERAALAAVIERARTAPSIEVIDGGLRRDSVYSILGFEPVEVLRAHDREVAAKALEAVADEMEAVWRSGRLLNGPTDDWLRARATTIREGS